jgi:hypothetical protein
MTAIPVVDFFEVILVLELNTDAITIIYGVYHVSRRKDLTGGRIARFIGRADERYLARARWYHPLARDDTILTKSGYRGQ